MKKRGALNRRDDEAKKAMGDKRRRIQGSGEKGDRKGPRPSQPNPRLYYDYGRGSRCVIIVEAGVDDVDGWGPLRSPFLGYMVFAFSVKERMIIKNNKWGN